MQHSFMAYRDDSGNITRAIGYGGEQDGLGMKTILFRDNLEYTGKSTNFKNQLQNLDCPICKVAVSGSAQELGEIWTHIVKKYEQELLTDYRLADNNCFTVSGRAWDSIFSEYPKYQTKPLPHTFRNANLSLGVMVQPTKCPSCFGKCTIS